MITKQDKTQEVDYDDTAHRYYLGSRVYRSATQIVERFVEHFDVEERSAYMADRYGQTQQYWKDKWRSGNQSSLDRGTLIHNQKEDFLHGRGHDNIDGKIFRVHNIEAPNFKESFAKSGLDYSRLPDGVYPELKLWRHDWGIAGRVDKPILETIHGIRYANIEDYKTNKAIRRESYQDKFGKHRMMLGPLHHLQDCEFNHYALQLSIYQFMLEYFGFKPGYRRVIHYPHREEWMSFEPVPKTIELPYMKTEVIAMLHSLKYDKWLQ